MSWQRIGWKFRVLRRRRRWQRDLAERAKVSRKHVIWIETGRGARVRGVVLEPVAEALGASLRLDLMWQGADLDRLLDASHAALQEHLAELLRRWGWEVGAEVSFNHYVDRGRYDLLAYHPATRTLLVIEIKSSLGDLQETFGRLDIKVRVSTHVVPATCAAASGSVRRLLTPRPRCSRLAPASRRASPGRAPVPCDATCAECEPHGHSARPQLVTGTSRGTHDEFRPHDSPITSRYRNI